MSGLLHAGPADASAEEVAKAFYTPPWKEPSEALFKVLGLLVEASKSYTSTTEAMTGSAPSTGPVGTMVALIEQGSKVFSGIHKRLHKAKRDEYRLLARLNFENVPQEGYPYDESDQSRMVFAQDFGPAVDVLPVSDPNIFSAQQRIAIGQTLLMLAEQAPDLYDRHEAHRRMLEALKVPAIDDVLMQPAAPEQLDPVTENMKMLNGQPAHAFPEQHHEAHIKVHQDFMMHPGFGGNPEVQEVVGPPMTAHMAEHLGFLYQRHMMQAAGKALPSEVASAIVTRTDGVPLFVEELTKAVLESGLLSDAGGRFELSGPLPPLAIPATLHDSLMARLDRLAPVKEVAQIGAVIGREFSYELLVAVADRPEDRVRAALDQLVQSELIFRHGTPPQASYSFKHALVQDVAYQSLLKSRRQQLHGRIARTLEEEFSGAVAAQPQLLARHYTEAGLFEEATDYWYQAGWLASERSALTEAVDHFGKALELVTTLRDSSVRVQREIDLQIALGGALISAKGHAAPETGRAYARAHELCLQVGDEGRLFPVLFGRWVFHLVRAEHAAAQDIAMEFLRSAERVGDSAGLVVGHRAAGIGCLWRGELVAARGHLERTLSAYDPERHRSLASVYAYDPRIAGLAGLAFALFQLGYPEQAVARCCAAVEAAERLSHPAGVAYALFHACMLDQVRRDVPCLRQRAAALIRLSAEHGFAQWRAVGVAFEGWAIAEQGRAVEGMERIQAGLDAYRATGAALFVPYSLALLGVTHGAAGRAAEGQRLVAEALIAADATGERWFEAELHRLEGELLRSAGGDQAAAEAGFLRAIAVAREQSAKLWELRAATSLARLWAERGEWQKAHNLLAPFDGWFTEGFNTADLKGAKALLDELA